MSNENDNKEFTTKDLTLVTTLTTLKFFNTGVDYQNEGLRNHPVAYFSFEQTPELDQTIEDFKRGKLAVEPRQYMFNLREIKSEINNVYKNPKNNFTSN